MTVREFTPTDDAVRDEIRTRVDINLCVEAGAGTGKTTVMVDRVVRIVASGWARIEEVAVITFTEKAAAELAARVRERLDVEQRRTHDDAERARLAQAMRDLSRAHIETIHAFAASLLRERPIEANLDPGFRVLVDLPAQLDFEAAYDEWLTEQMASEPPPEALVNALNLGLDFKLVREAAERLHDNRDLLPLPPFVPAPLDVDDAIRRIGAALASVRELTPIEEDDKAYRSLRDTIAIHEELERLGDYPDALRRAIVTANIGNYNGNQRHWRRADDCREVKAALKFVDDVLDGCCDHLRGQAVAALLDWLQGFVRAYDGKRRVAGTADFHDLLIWARELVRNSRDVRRYFQERFRCVLVDEFQDTDPLQVELIMFLCEDGQDAGDWRDVRLRPGSLFVVGDPKQSIYRFRRADIAMYDEVKSRLFDGKVRDIVQNFRSVEEIIAWANGVFGALMIEDPGVQPRYIELVAPPVDAPDQPAVTVLRGVAGGNSPSDVRRAEADALASLIASGVGGGGWSVRGDDGARAARYADVAVLIPSRTELVIYEEAFTRAGVPYRHEGGRSFFQRQEVRELIAVLRAIDDPSDGVATVAALRSSAFGCSDEDLLLYRNGGGSFQYRGLSDGASGEIPDALRLLAEFERKRHDVRLPDLVRAVLDRTRLVEFAMLQPQGEQLAANLLKIIDQARELSDASEGGLRSFVRWLKQNVARSADETEAAISEETDDVVRIVTIHSAKGLEFPIVAFANMNTERRTSTRVITTRTGERAIDMRLGRKENRFQTPAFDEAEEAERAYAEAEDLRLLYVAATRARDMLIVPLFEPGERKKRAPSLNDRLRDGGAANHMAEIEARSLAPVQPELPIWRRTPAAGAEADVVRVIEAREGWKAAHNTLIDGATEPLRIVTASALKAEWTAPRSDEAMVRRGRAADFGTAVHAVLERVDLRRPEDAAAVSGAVAAEYGMSRRADEMAALARQAMASGVIARANRSKRVLREASFSAALPDAANSGLAEGRIDLLFEEDGGIVIVDFKTDAVSAGEVEARAEHYRRQALVYAWATHEGTGMPVREVILLFARVPGERGEWSMPCDAAFMAEAEELMRNPTADLEEEIAV